MCPNSNNDLAVVFNPVGEKVWIEGRLDQG